MKYLIRLGTLSKWMDYYGTTIEEIEFTPDRRMAFADTLDVQTRRLAIVRQFFPSAVLEAK